MSNYDRKIILKPKGDGRREVRLGDLQIPDLWHFAESTKALHDRVNHVIGKLDDIIENIEDRDDRKKLGELLLILRGEKKVKENLEAENTDGERARTQILGIWNLAHDLKLNLAGDTGPK